MARVSPFGYCPECGKSGIKEDGGVISCSEGHTYSHFEAKWPDRELFEDEERRSEPNPWGMSTIPEKTPPVEEEKVVPISSVKETKKVTELDLITLAKDVQKNNERIEKGFLKIHQSLKDLLAEVEEYF